MRPDLNVSRASPGELDPSPSTQVPVHRLAGSLPPSFSVSLTVRTLRFAWGRCAQLPKRTCPSESCPRWTDIGLRILPASLVPVIASSPCQTWWRSGKVLISAYSETVVDNLPRRERQTSTHALWWTPHRMVRGAVRRGRKATGPISETAGLPNRRGSPGCRENGDPAFV